MKAAVFTHRQMRKALLSGLVTSCLLIGSHVAAQDQERGQALAQQWCVDCHLVEEGQETAGDTAPSFLVIANDPEKTPDYLTTWLTAPHYPMPDFQLGRREIADLVAYIQSLSDS